MNGHGYRKKHLRLETYARNDTTVAKLKQMELEVLDKERIINILTKINEEDNP